MVKAMHFLKGGPHAIIGRILVQRYRVLKESPQSIPGYHVQCWPAHNFFFWRCAQMFFNRKAPPKCT